MPTRPCDERVGPYFLGEMSRLRINQYRIEGGHGGNGQRGTHHQQGNFHWPFKLPDLWH